MPQAPRKFRIRHGLEPGDLGMVVHLHGLLYAREYGLDTTFEPYVAKPLADFVLGGSGRLWIAEDETRMVGSIALVEAGGGEGQLRWFLVVPEARGTGLGRRLLEEALAYARQRGLSRVFLWSFADLTDALRLYERAGFRTTQTRTGVIWGAQRTEVRMDLALGARASAMSSSR
jgi:GNAT superfamily N-acetyltransferase